MAIIRRGILGGFSGKIANVVGSSWKGIAVMRTLPLSVANPRTPAQVAQRSKFTLISEFASAILTTMIKPLWDRHSQKMSGYNAFIQQNIKNAVTDKAIIWSNLILSRGQLGVTPILKIINGSGGFEVEWNPNITNAMQSPTDFAYLLIVDEVSGKVIGTVAGEANRESGTAAVQADTSQYTKIGAYLSFANADLTRVGDSSYLSLTL